MEELGISDVEDISDPEDIPLSPPFPESTPPAVDNGKADSDWEASAMSDIMATPRPGILKKWSNVRVNNI